MAGREVEGSDGRQMGSDGRQMGSDGRDRGNGEYPPSVQASLLLLF